VCWNVVAALRVWLGVVHWRSAMAQANQTLSSRVKALQQNHADTQQLVLATVR
jgi:hypothetical protein